MKGRTSGADKRILALLKFIRPVLSVNNNFPHPIGFPRGTKFLLTPSLKAENFCIHALILRVLFNRFAENSDHRRERKNDGGGKISIAISCNEHYNL